VHWTSNIDNKIEKVELRKSPLIIRVNKFDEESAKKFSDEIALAHNTGQDIIPIVIDSYGGQVYSLMAMISAIKHAELPVATIVEGKAMSCGAILFSFGEQGRRFMDPDATLMIHDVSSMDMGKVEELKASAKEADRLNKIVYEMMAQNCGKVDDYFMKIVDKKKHADWFLNAKQAKSHGLANYLRVPKLSIKVTVDIDFE
jgi:ATP-dependent Clp endopeptidase proteolytic subunit ClpP|tara:strand:- start:2081 stop:2683 length:603 start_codon:yes stop_codon:yes gene_type:complete